MTDSALFEDRSSSDAECFRVNLFHSGKSAEKCDCFSNDLVGDGGVLKGFAVLINCVEEARNSVESCFVKGYAVFYYDKGKLFLVEKVFCGFEVVHGWLNTTRTAE